MSTDDGTYASLLARIEDIEVRYAYLERLLGELDGVIRETADELARVGRVVTELRHRAEAEADQVQRRSAEEEKPPHY